MSRRPDPADRATADQNFAHAREAFDSLTKDVAKKLDSGADVVDVWIELGAMLVRSDPDVEFLAVLLAAAIIQQAAPKHDNEGR